MPFFEFVWIQPPFKEERLNGLDDRSEAWDWEGANGGLDVEEFPILLILVNAVTVW